MHPTKIPTRPEVACYQIALLYIHASDSLSPVPELHRQALARRFSCRLLLVRPLHMPPRHQSDLSLPMPMVCRDQALMAEFAQLLLPLPTQPLSSLSSPGWICDRIAVDRTGW